MPVLSSRVAATATALLAVTGSVSASSLHARDEDIISYPLEWLGANSPYFDGPNINGISNEVPEGCVVDQVAYVMRHGSRYPDSGAYAEWVALYQKVRQQWCLSLIGLNMLIFFP